VKLRNITFAIYLLGDLLVKKTFLVALATLAAYAFASSSSQAALAVTFAVTGQSPVTVNDNGPGDESPALSRIAYGNTITGSPITIGAITISDFITRTDFSTLTKSLITTNIGSLSQSGGINTITITITENGFGGTLPGFVVGTRALEFSSVQNAGLLSGTGGAAGTISTTVTDNSVNYPTAPIAITDNNTGPATVFTRTSPTYTLTSVISVTLSGNVSLGGLQQLNSQVVAAPAPSALLLAGLGVPMFGVFRRGFRARKGEPTAAV
jgi:hypothetical protein